MNRAFYLPSSLLNSAWGVSLTAAGHGRVRRGNSYPLGGHPQDHALSWERWRAINALQAVYIPEGAGEFQTTLSDLQKIYAGSVFFLIPGVAHRYRPLPDIGWVEDWVELRGPVIKKLVASRIIDAKSPVVQVGNSEGLSNLFRQCVDLADQKPAGFEGIAGAIGLQILALAHSLSKQGTSSEKQWISSAVSRGQSLIGRHIDKGLRTFAIAGELGVSESYFRRAFKSQTGLTPKQYHVQLRLQKAEELLLRTSLSIKEIAATLGFDSAFHFSAHFKAKIGSSPDRWRKNVLS